MVPGMGGAMDLVSGASCRRDATYPAKGNRKSSRMRFPLLAASPVTMVVTDLAVIIFKAATATLFWKRLLGFRSRMYSPQPKNRINSRNLGQALSL